MIEVKIKAHDLENAGSVARIKAILRAAGVPVAVDNETTIKLTQPGTFVAEADHEGTKYTWLPVAEEVAA